MHEMDNYFTVGSPNSSMSTHYVETIPDVASQVGIPLTPDKLVGPTTRVVFLSIFTFLAESEFFPPDQQYHLHNYRSQNSSILHRNNSKDFSKIHVYI